MGPVSGFSVIGVDSSWSSGKNSVEPSGTFAGALFDIVDDGYAAGVKFKLGSTLFLFLRIGGGS